jgi:hypothetical protein
MQYSNRPLRKTFLSSIHGSIGKGRSGSGKSELRNRGGQGLREMQLFPRPNNNATNNGVGHLSSVFQKWSNRLQLQHQQQLILHNSVKWWRGWALLVLLVLLLPVGPLLGITLASDIEIFD